MEGRLLPLIEVARSEMDGIPVFAIDGPRPFTAQIVFRVGYYDEHLRNRGITHLVEHLALYGLRDSEIAFNGTVSSHLTTFIAQGHPDEVGAFLRSVCGLIHDLPYDRLGLEADVLRREGAPRSFSFVEMIIWAYFGSRGPGVSGFPEFGLGWLSPDDIEAWAKRYFNKRNAAIVIVGDVPDSFGIELPDGNAEHYVAPARTKPAPESATLYETQEHGVTWATLIKNRKGRPEPAFFVGLDIVSRRLESRLRHDLGQTYSVPFDWHRIDADHIVATHGFDCEPTRSRDAGLEHLKVMREFMETGPTQAELDRALRVQVKMYQDHPLEAAQHRLFDEAETHLAGWGSTISIDEYRRQMERLTPDEIAERFREAYRQSFTIADLPRREFAERLSMIDFGQPPFEGVQFVSKRSHRRDQARLVRIGPEGVSALFAEGWLNTPLDQIALVIADDESVRVLGDWSTMRFEADKYAPGSPLRKRPVRLGLGVLLLLAGALVGVAAKAALAALVLLMIASMLITSDFGDEYEKTAISDRRLSMQDAVRRYVPPDQVLPAPRSE
jgi:hypothetical protein